MKKIFYLFLIFIFYNFLYSLELPTQDVSVLRVGVVDMNRILEEYSKSQKLQKELQLFKENKKAEIAELEKEVENLLKKKLEITVEIEQLKQQVKQLEVSVSSSEVMQSSASVQTSDITSQLQQIKSTIEAKQKNIDEIEKTILDKKEQLKQKQKDIDLEVEKMKEKFEMEIYAELYNLIKKVAEEERLNIVIDKSGILYGESKIDITDKVLKLIK
jgi:Skp family chaperone for outer membrane proteins